MFFQTYICICIDTFPYLGTKRNEEFLIIHVKKCYSIIIRSYVFTYVCSLVGWKMANTTTIGEKDRFIGRIYSKELTVLINGNRFVSVKKKKNIGGDGERERDADFSLLFIHIPSVSLPSINSIDFALSSKFHPRASVLIRHRCSPYFSPPTIARLIQRAAFVSAYFIDFAELSLF